MKNNCCSGNESPKSGCIPEGMEEAANPMMDMCKSMMDSINNTAQMAGFATSEVRALFEDWANEVENEVLSHIKNKGQVDPNDIANELKISENSILYFISKLIRERKIKVVTVQVIENPISPEERSSL
jgi:hypothetical protein